MNLGIFLPPGDSLKNMSKSGQDDRFVNLYLKKYAAEFENVYIFSYEHEKFDLIDNVYIIPRSIKTHRLVYGLFLPIINFDTVNKCDVIRGLSLPSAISSLFLWKPFVVNWAYDYIDFVKIEGKFIYIPLFFLLEKLAFLKSKKVFVATKRKFKTLNSKKFVYLPNGVDIKVFNPPKIRKEGLIFIGRLEKQKNLFFLLKTLSLLPGKYRKIEFIGTGSLEKKLERFAKAKEIRLKITPKISNNKLPKYLSNSTLFLLPSLNEGIPKVLIEAMALGLVPIVTNFSTAAEVIDDGKDGFIVEFDESKFAEKIKLLLENSALRNQMSREAVSKIKKDFNLEVHLKQEVRILKNG